MAQLARVLRQSTDRPVRVASQLLELARIEARSPTRDLESVDLVALLRGMVARMVEDERFAGVSFTVAPEC